LALCLLARWVPYTSCKRSAYPRKAVTFSAVMPRFSNQAEALGVASSLMATRSPLLLVATFGRARRVGRAHRARLGHPSPAGARVR